MRARDSRFLDILRALSSPSARLDPHNRALPMIDELELEDMVFGIFPLVRPGGLTVRWFNSTNEVFQALDEVLSVSRPFSARGLEI